MKKIKVIHTGDLPGKVPINSTLVYILALDHWKAPQWLWAVVLTLVVLVWILFIVRLRQQEPTKLFENRKSVHYDG